MNEFFFAEKCIHYFSNNYLLQTTASKAEYRSSHRDTFKPLVIALMLRFGHLRF